MSFAAIILGLLIWFSFPALYKRSISRRALFYLRLACKCVGIAIIAIAFVVSLFR